MYSHMDEQYEDHSLGAFSLPPRTEPDLNHTTNWQLSIINYMSHTCTDMVLHNTKAKSVTKSSWLSHHLIGQNTGRSRYT